MKIVFIHGKKLRKDGALHSEFISRLKKGLDIYKKEDTDLIVVSGGKTRRKFPSEAEMAFGYLKKVMPEGKIIKLKNCYVTIEAVLAFNNFCKKLGNIEKINDLQTEIGRNRRIII